MFDFKEEDERSESVRYLGKLGSRKKVDDDVALNKYRVLECVAQGTKTQLRKSNSLPSIEAYAIDDDHNCDDVILYTHIDSEGVRYAANKEISGSASITLVCPGVPGHNQSSCAFSKSPSSNEAAVSDADESLQESSPSTSAADIAEDSVSLDERSPDHCFSAWEKLQDDVNMAVTCHPDYVAYRDNYCTESTLTFSSSCITIKGSTAYGNQGSFSFNWEIDDIVGIESQWCGRVETAVVKLHVVSKDAVSAEKLCSTSGIVEELKFAVVDPSWCERQEQITALDRKYKAVWNVGLDTEMETDGNALLGQNHLLIRERYFPNFDEPFEDVIYPKGDPDAVSISKRDVELLQPDTFINDTIIDFYIKYLKNQIQTDEKPRFHFFNSFFFRKLVDLDKDPASASEGRAAYQRVKKWTRKVNLFDKDYIFIPVNFNLHWSLIVICHPGEVATYEQEDIKNSHKVPCILHMDSIKGSHKGLKNLVQSYLLEEWKERQKDTSDDISSKFFNLRFVPLELPQQENSFDCGLFLLHYVELFLAEAPVNFNPFRITKFSNFLNVEWFPPAEASLKRAVIQRLIYELLDNHSRSISEVAGCSDNQHHRSKIPEIYNRNENEAGIEFISERSQTCNGNLLAGGNGIEMTLLETSSSQRNSQSVSTDSSLVLREFFEPVANGGSFLEHFDQTACFQQFKGALSTIEEDPEPTGGFTYLPSDNTGFHQTDGIRHEEAYSSGDLSMPKSTNQIITLQHEYVNESSPEPSICASDSSLEVEVTRNSALEDDMSVILKRPKSPSIGKSDCVTVDSPCAVQESPVGLLNRGFDLEGNREDLCSSVQIIGENLVNEQQPVKRQRLMSPLDGEARFAGNLSKEFCL